MVSASKRVVGFLVTEHVHEAFPILVPASQVSISGNMFCSLNGLPGSVCSAGWSVHLVMAKPIGEPHLSVYLLQLLLLPPYMHSTKSQLRWRVRVDGLSAFLQLPYSSTDNIHWHVPSFDDSSPEWFRTWWYWYNRKFLVYLLLVQIQIWSSNHCMLAV